MTYTREDFEYSAPPRIMGSETEYTTEAIPFDLGLQRYIDNIETYRMESRDDGAELWLENGARLYLDCGGAVLEYATPETTSAHGVAKYELAGERTVQAYAENAAAAMTESKYPVSNKVYKRSGYDDIKHNGVKVLQRMSTGHHENYLTSAHIAARYTSLRIGSYLASRTIWAGAGLVTQLGFELSQKTSAIDFYSEKKTSDFGSKSPYRMEAGDEPLRRLEIRVGDGNMLPAAIIRKFAVTSFILRMIEHGAFPIGLTIDERDQAESFRRTSQLKPIRVRNVSMSAAEHQIAILRSGLEYFGTLDSVTVPAEEVAAVLDTIAICNVISGMQHIEESGQLIDDVDWAAKLQLMRERGISAPSGENLDAVMLDIRYEDISANGLSRQRQLLAQKSSPFDETSVQAAQILPPPTRAQRRSDLLRSLPSYPTMIHWHRVEHERALYPMRDPYQAI